SSAHRPPAPAGARLSEAATRPLTATSAAVSSRLAAKPSVSWPRLLQHDTHSHPDYDCAERVAGRSGFSEDRDQPAQSGGVVAAARLFSRVFWAVQQASRLRLTWRNRISRMVALHRVVDAHPTCPRCGRRRQTNRALLAFPSNPEGTRLVVGIHCSECW